MKITEDETTSEREYRRNILNNYTRKTSPLILLVLLVAVALALFIWATSISIENGQYGVGNPYNCSDCRSLRIACEEHRNYNISNELNSLVDKYTIYFKPGGTEEENTLNFYGYGLSYNKECDFCVIEEKECYGCQYTREAIKEIVCKITADDLFKSRLCDSCWELKYANCSICRQMLAQLAKDAIKS